MWSRNQGCHSLPARIGQNGRLDAVEGKYTRYKTKTHCGDVRGIRTDFGEMGDSGAKITGAYEPACGVLSSILGQICENERYSV